MTERVNKVQPDARQVCLLLATHATVSEPEQLLVFAIIKQMVIDLMAGGANCKNSRYLKAKKSYDIASATRREVSQFALSPAFIRYCDYVDLNYQWVLEVLRDYAGLDVVTNGCKEA